MVRRADPQIQDRSDRLYQIRPSPKPAGRRGVINQKMPDRNGEFEYRVRNIAEPHERVFRESQLSATL